MSMTPYEVRLNVLNLAKSILDTNSTTNLNTVALANSINSSNIANISGNGYTTDDVISSATKLYSFVRDNSNSSSN